MKLIGVSRIKDIRFTVHDHPAIDERNRSGDTSVDRDHTFTIATHHDDGFHPLNTTPCA